MSVRSGVAAGLSTLALCATVGATPAAGGGAPAWPAWTLEGSTDLELRLFQHAALLPGQHRTESAVVLRPVWSAQYGADRSWELRVAPYLRWDQRDPASRYVDLREATVRHRAGDSLWRIGIETVHWGVVESMHLVNIVNQVDPRADPYLEAKLGQPMLGYTYFGQRSGRIEVMWLPYFRARPRVGVDGRLHADPPATSAAPHGLGPWRRTDDMVLRWQDTLGVTDLSAYAFSGLSREPDVDAQGSEQYRRIRQLGMSLQHPQGNLLWKSEALLRQGQGRSFMAYVVGGEHSITLPYAEVGLLLERVRDHRDQHAPPAQFADAWLAGLRLRPNDIGDSELLYGALHDRGGRAWLHKLEYSRRLWSGVRMEMVARVMDCTPGSAYGTQCRTSHVQARVSYNF